MTKLTQVLGFIVGISIALSSCLKENTPPAYIRIENIFFEADTTKGQGSSSSAIVDVWPSVDGQQLGTNTLPAMFPVIVDPNFPTNSVRISAGIKDNGIGNTRVIYPFYEPYLESIKLEPGQTYTFSPTLRYDTAASVIVVEDFESPNQPIFTDDQDGNTNTEMVHQITEVFEGTNSGLIVLDSANLQCDVASSSRFFNLQPSFATPVYLEINYKTDAPFQVGIVAHYPSGNSETLYKGGCNPTTEWKKIYFNITNEIYGSGAPEFAVIFSARKPLNLTKAEIYLDNVKLLHY